MKNKVRDQSVQLCSLVMVIISSDSVSRKDTSKRFCSHFQNRDNFCKQRVPSLVFEASQNLRLFLKVRIFFKSEGEWDTPKDFVVISERETTFVDRKSFP